MNTLLQHPATLPYLLAALIPLSESEAFRDAGGQGVDTEQAEEVREAWREVSGEATRS